MPYQFVPDTTDYSKVGKRLLISERTGPEY